MYNIEMILLRECCQNKSTRENLIASSISEYHNLCMEIIEVYDLKRVNDKYVMKIRDYTENSYSKKKIKEEEVIFIRKSYMYLNLHKAMIQNIKFKHNANAITADIYDDSKLKEKDKIIYETLFDTLYKELVSRR